MEKVYVLISIFVIWAVYRVVKCFMQGDSNYIIPSTIGEYLPDVVYYLVLIIVIIIKESLLPFIFCGVIYIIFF